MYALPKLVKVKVLLEVLAVVVTVGLFVATTVIIVNAALFPQ